ncbi:hypothetical protein [Hyphomonas sp.]|uniref:hypothetical protein n=1 Tax=Hyphomonas sp. TaxID=87 RepID=UPI000C8ABE34|nr:hypothetical protein [Hyphomonas sp.]MAL46877.1 hypothetical protein [Hyphomonas sp.]
MVVEKRITGEPTGVESESITIETPDESLTVENVELTDDGGAIVNPIEDEPENEFDQNLAELLSDDDLNMISSDLIGDYKEDKSSREEWHDAYSKGLKLLGFNYEDRSQPFQGASGVTHPLLSETVTQFQAQAYKELLPANGPVRTQIIGSSDSQKEEQAQRVQEFMNYQIMHVMEDFDPDLDQMLFYLPLSGSSFKKVYYDSTLDRAVSKFVPSEDVVVPYTATDLASAERITHVLRRNENEIRKLQVQGFYSDVEIKEQTEEPNSQIQDAVNKLDGVRKTGSGYSNDNYTLLEIHCELDLPGFEDEDGIKLPYIVTIDEGSQKVLSIYRNYDEKDTLKKKKQYFVHYKFLPGLGFYGFGLIHMLGGLSRTATAALRQLLDAGTLANLPAGFKARGLRIRDDDNPIQPGEFRDVDAPSGDLRAGLMPLPYKGADATLFQLLGFVVQAGQRFATIADQKIGDSVAANAPVGTTMALIERGSRVMSAIHKRLHYAQKTEFNLLARVFKEFYSPMYPYDVGKNAVPSIKSGDFDERIDIIPVSDPNIFSMSQRVTLAQTQLQMAQSDPNQHNLYEAYKRMYQALGVKDIDAILPVPKPDAPKDPGLENSDALMGKKLIAFRGQAHQQHIEAHRVFMSSLLVRSNPQASTLLQAHVMEHVSLLAREQVEAQMNQVIEQEAQKFGGQIPPQLQMEFQKQVEVQVADLVSNFISEMFIEEQESMQPQGQDPLISLKEQELQLRAQDIQRKAQNDSQKLELDAAKLDQQAKIAQDKIDSNEDIAQLRANVNLDKQKN